MVVVSYNRLMSDAVTVAVIAGISAVMAAMVPLLITARRAARSAQRMMSDIREIHILVNSQKAEAAAYRDLLIYALRSAGLEVPPDPQEPD